LADVATERNLHEDRLFAGSYSTPGAVLLCKFNDDDSEPYPKKRYEDLFTPSGVGKANMVDFFGDMSHGKLDLRGSQVFGWYTLDKSRSDYFFVENGQTQARRGELLDWARQAAADDLTKGRAVLFSGGLHERADGPVRRPWRGCLRRRTQAQ
jgi:hypothetical protein